MVLSHICGTLEVFVVAWLVAWLVSPQFGVYCIFLWLNKAAPVVGAALLRWHWKGFQAAPAELM